MSMVSFELSKLYFSLGFDNIELQLISTIRRFYEAMDAVKDV